MAGLDQPQRHLEWLQHSIYSRQADFFYLFFGFCDHEDMPGFFASYKTVDYFNVDGGLHVKKRTRVMTVDHPGIYAEDALPDLTGTTTETIDPTLLDPTGLDTTPVSTFEDRFGGYADLAAAAHAALPDKLSSAEQFEDVCSSSFKPSWIAVSFDLSADPPVVPPYSLAERSPTGWNEDSGASFNAIPTLIMVDLFDGGSGVGFMSWSGDYDPFDTGHDAPWIEAAPGGFVHCFGASMQWRKIGHKVPIKILWASQVNDDDPDFDDETLEAGDETGAVHYLTVKEGAAPNSEFVPLSHLTVIAPYHGQSFS